MNINGLDKLGYEHRVCSKEVIQEQVNIWEIYFLLLHSLYWISQLLPFKKNYNGDRSSTTYICNVEHCNGYTA